MHTSIRSLVVFTFLLVALGVWSPAFAHVPVLVEQDSLHDIEPIAHPEASQAFYGRLEGFPHTYEIRTKEPFTLFVEVLVPDIDAAENIVSGIVIKETGNKGRVEEVTRLLARDATWERFYEPWGGDHYRRGGRFEADVAPGVYRIEVSTPDNLSPYVLVVGTKEGVLDVGYFETIGRLMEVKRFFGVSVFWVILSPLVYIPLLIMLVVGALITVIRRRRARSLLRDGEGVV